MRKLGSNTVVLLGVAIVALALIADWLGIGAHPGFGQIQLLLAAAGVLVFICGIEFRTGWFRSQPPSIRQGSAVVSIVLLGAFLRLIHLAFVGLAMPFRYGGLFSEFSTQIAANGGGMPNIIPFYTDGGIPFAYPPLPFYIEAALLSILSLPEFLVVNLLPPSLAVLALTSFYFLTRELGLRPRAQLAALVAYAAMPTAFQNQIEGAGLAEALGSVVLIWFALSLLRAFKRGGIGDYVISGVLWAASVASSPGSAYASLPMILIFVASTVARNRRQFGLRNGGYLVVTGTVAVVASSPYWLTAMTHHGIGIFVDPFIAQHIEWGWSVSEIPRRFLDPDVSGAPYPLLWDVVILSGVIWAMFSRRWALVAWFIALYAIPREGVWLVAIPGALLAGLGWVEMLGPRIDVLRSAYLRGRDWKLVSSGLTLLVVSYVMANAFITVRGMVVSGESIGPVPTEGWGLTPDSIAAMVWAEANTPEESKFIVLSRSQVKEWTPHVARRTVLNMRYGSEWEPDERRMINTLEEALNNCEDFDCLQDSVSMTMGYRNVFILIERHWLSKLLSHAGREGTRESAFELLWQNDEIAIGRLSANEEASDRIGDRSHILFRVRSYMTN